MINTQELSRILDSKPEKQTVFVYQAIVLSLAAHIVVFALIFLSGNPSSSRSEDPNDPGIQELDLSFEPPEEEVFTDMPQGMSEEVRNLLANSESQTTKERVSYSAKSKAQIEQEVLNDLKNLEASEYSKLKEGRPDSKEAVADKKETQTATPESKEDYSWINQPSDKSYEGRVAASFQLSGRKPLNSPKPLYRCKSAGLVVVKIEVDQFGKVTSALVDESKSVANECLREESKKYALKWMFDYSDKAPKRQEGTISFDFSAQ